MAHGTYQTINPRAVTDPLRSIPLFRHPGAVFGPSKRDYLIGDLRTALDARPGYARMYADACAKLAQANRTLPQHRRFHQAAAMRAINQMRAAIRANDRAIQTAEAALLALDAGAAQA